MPDAERLEAAALRLAAQGDVRTLVAMVERWSQVGEPTQRALLAQIAGFLDLCMMDRAWTRLQSLPDIEPLRRERVLLTARMFIERGWPRRARRLLDEALAAWPDDPELTRLGLAADEPPRRAPAAEPDPEAPFADQLAAAEAWLATGAFLKAHRLLDQLQRRFPAEARPADLLWALKGDYELAGTTLQRLAAAPVSASEPAIVGELADEPERTEAAPAAFDAADAAPAPRLSGAEFPDLFGSGRGGRDGGLGLRDEETAEITQATRLGDLVAAGRAGAAGGRADDRDEDTQVLRIVSNGAGAGSLVPATAKEYQPGPPTLPGIREELEGEDEAVVHLTRPQDRQPPVELRRAPTLPDPGPRRRGRAESDAALPVVVPDGEAEPLAPPGTPPSAPAAASGLPGWLWGVAVALGVVGVALAVVAAWSAGLLR